MKKTILLTIGILFALLATLFALVPPHIVNMITHYEPYTFEAVLDYDSMRTKYGIYDRSNPGDYGFEEYTEVQFRSFKDSIGLSGWYIPSAPNTDQCIVLVHGRTSNRLKPMKYLQLFKDIGLDTVYNFFIPELRNSGKSEASKTYMGYKFGEDLASSLSFLKTEYNQKEIVVYSFSMGAMATFTLLGRPELQNYLNQHQVTINKIIVDSPLSNVRATLKVSSDEMHLPDFVFNRVFNLFSNQINGFGDSLNMHTLLQNVDQPIFLIQSTSDDTTPFAILEEELNLLKSRENIQTWIVDGPGHVLIYQDSAFMQTYTAKVEEFMK